MIRKTYLVLLMILVLMCSGCFSPYDYPPSGKDTTEVFGNGEFQMSRSPDGHELLANEKFNKIVIASIIAWEQHGNKAYFVGTDGNNPTEGVKMYGVLNIDENILQLFWEGELDSSYILTNVTALVEGGSATILSSPSEFSQEDWAILLKLDGKKID